MLKLKVELSAQRTKAVIKPLYASGEHAFPTNNLAIFEAIYALELPAAINSMVATLLRSEEVIRAIGDGLLAYHDFDELEYEVNASADLAADRFRVELSNDEGVVISANTVLLTDNVFSDIHKGDYREGKSR